MPYNGRQHWQLRIRVDINRQQATWLAELAIPITAGTALVVSIIVFGTPDRLLHGIDSAGLDFLVSEHAVGLLHQVLLAPSHALVYTSRSVLWIIPIHCYKL